MATTITRILILLCLIGAGCSMDTAKLEDAATRASHKAKLLAREKGFPDNMRGLCILGSRILYDELKEEGLQPIFAIYKKPSKNHCYIVCSNHVVDITATQYDKPAICIIPTEDAKEAYWQPAVTLATHELLIQFLKSDECPEKYWKFQINKE